MKILITHKCDEQIPIVCESHDNFELIQSFPQCR